MTEVRVVSLHRVRLCSWILHHGRKGPVHPIKQIGSSDDFSHASQGNLFKPCLTFLRGKIFFPSFCENQYSLWPLKLPWNAFLRAYICKKFLVEDPQTPTFSMESPPAPSTHATLLRVASFCGLSHCFVPSCPTHKFPVKRPGNTNLWLKPWLNVTNPNHKEYLWVYRQILTFLTFKKNNHF